MQPLRKVNAFTSPLGLLSDCHSLSLAEFQPGVPWKGIDRVDPESNPYMTPGGLMGNAVSPNLNDSEHQLLQDNTGKYFVHHLNIL